MKLMHALVLFTIAAGLLLSADDKAKGTDNKQETTKSSGKGHPLTLPKEAVRIEQYAYRYKDPLGKVWIYRETPFGLVRYEENKEEATAAAKPKQEEPDIQATEDGETIRFERPGPFGKWRWSRKKTDELNDEERAAWERAQKTPKPADKSSAKTSGAKE